MLRLLLVPLLAPLIACAPKGATNRDTGLEGVATSEGALSGSWAAVVEFDTIVPAGILGDQKGGFRSHFLVERSFSGGHYAESYRRCARDAFEVGGSTTLVPPDTFPMLALIPGTAEVDHAAGTYATSDINEMWGLQNLPEPATTTLPTKDNYQQSPQSDWVLDEDQDGAPAVTQYSRGTVGGRMYVVERTVFALEGTVLSADHVSGLMRLRSNDSSRLGSTAALLLGSSTSWQDPDRVSWFDAVRLGANATCDDVANAIATGKVAMTKPF